MKEYLKFFLTNIALLVLPFVIWGGDDWAGPAIAMTIVSAVIAPLQSKMTDAFVKDRFPF